MLGALGACSNEIFEAVVALSHSIAGRTDLRSLLSGVAESLGRIVDFDHVGVILHDPIDKTMHGHILNAPGNPVITELRLPVDEDPAGWVWRNQQPLVFPSSRKHVGRAGRDGLASCGSVHSSSSLSLRARIASGHSDSLP
jgi:hypothetical protein